MARGWDSKAIEDQIADAEAAKAVREKPFVSPEEQKTLAHVRSIELSRTHVLHQLESSRDERYRTQLRAALDHLESQLAALKPPTDSC